MSKHGLLMLACCLLPLALLGAVYSARVDLVGILPFAIMLLCPLTHILVLRGMGLNHGGHGGHRPSRRRQEPGGRDSLAPQQRPVGPNRAHGQPKVMPAPQDRLALP